MNPMNLMPFGSEKEEKEADEVKALALAMRRWEERALALTRAMPGA